MDNVTHTLIGIVNYRLLPERFRTRATFWAAVVGNNIPDCDVLQRFWPNLDDLSYIVHHRGYTHSFAWAIPLGLFVGIVVNLIFKRPWRDPAALAVGAGAGVLHFLADGMNSYGVHPITPFSNGWFYGDTLFILEPLLWIALIPVAYLTMQSNRGRTLWILVFAGFQFLVWRVSWLGTPAALFLSVGGAAICFGLVWQRKAGMGIALAMMTVLTFFGASRWARSEAVEAWRKTGLTQERLVDVESSPFPGNPACWRVWVRTETESHWTTRLAGVSLLPHWIAPEICAVARGRNRTAETALPLLRPSARVAWSAQSDLEKDLHFRLAEKSCRYRRFLNFARLPFLSDIGDDGSSGPWIAGDLRYDNEPELGFAEFLVATDDDCEGFRTDFWERPSETARQ